MSSRAIKILAGFGLAAVLAGCTAPNITEPVAPDVGTAVPGAPIPADANSALLDMVSELRVAGRAPKTGYDRDLFGAGWKDPDRNGCDARNDILARDLTDVVRDGPCTVLSGVLDDPFTGETIHFQRGNTTSMAVQIDHVVALSDAWQKGAQQWDEPTRVEFANDPLNLIAVDGPANGAKGDSDAATWLPPNKAFRCDYVGLQVQVKHKYGVWVTEAERDAMVRVLSDCDPAAPVVDPVTEPEPATEPDPEEPVSDTPTGDDVYYKNCAAARDAGAAPVKRGDPGYGSHLDRDGDGVGCV